MKIHREIIGNGVTGGRWQRKGGYLADCRIVEDKGVDAWGDHVYMVEILNGNDKGMVVRVSEESLINE